ncbi:glycoside hydrolase family 64 protein [Winogradskya humida]|uniref:glycoside hydrolase family 64 protein n=1 Tax=Winogradskya humida TaxID=113566 RepID=UPI001EF38E9B|nr:glycoside hydrolase family 64 protein [Actinoplanes humidus]
MIGFVVLRGAGGWRADPVAVAGNPTGSVVAGPLASAAPPAGAAVSGSAQPSAGAASGSAQPSSGTPASGSAQPSASVAGPSGVRPTASKKVAGSGAFWDAGGIPKAKNVLTVKVLNRTNGKYPDSKVYWSFNGQTHSIAEQPFLDMPANSAGRMYFHLGSPDAALNDFVEFTVGADQFNGNTTRVDAFVLKLAMRLHSSSGADLTVGEDQATFAESRAATFRRFRDAVPAEFDHLAEGTTRILSPGGDPQFRAGGKYAGYFPGDIATSDIFGCAGPLSGKPDQCAQLNRNSTSASPSTFYQKSPANYYAKFWHDNAIGHKAYGFAYDDVAAQSTYISHTDPKYLLVAVGY